MRTLRAQTRSQRFSWEQREQARNALKSKGIAVPSRWNRRKHSEQIEPRHFSSIAPNHLLEIYGSGKEGGPSEAENGAKKQAFRLPGPGRAQIEHGPVARLRRAGHANFFRLGIDS